MKASSIAFVLIWAPCAALAQSDVDWKLCDAKDADTALPACTRFIETGKLDQNKRAVAHDSRGAAYWRKRDFNRAVADYDEAIRIDPQYVRAYMRRGATQASRGDCEKSIADSSKAIELDPRLADGYRIRGTAYERRNEFDRAIDDYAKYIEMNPKNFAYRRSLGLMRFLTADFKGASSDLARAFELRNDPYALLFRYLARNASGSRPRLDWRRRACSEKQPMAKRSDRCMAQFYIGEWHGLRDNRSEAAAMLNAATEICDRASIEYKAALAELQRLKP